MITVFIAILPFFLLLALGAVAGYSKRFAGTDKAINAFVYWFALPSFLFTSIANTDPASGIPLAFIAGTLAVTTLVWVGSYAIARWCAPLGQREQTGPFSLASCYGNVGYLGVPLVIALVGENAVLAAGIGQLLHNMLFMVVYPIVHTLAAHKAGKGGALPIWPILKRALLMNPVALSVVFGLVVAHSHLQLPGFIDNTITLLGQAAIPAAMFAIGSTLKSVIASIRVGGVRPSAMIAATLLKIAVMPAITLIMVRLLPGLLGSPWGPTMTLMAAMPVSTTAFLLAMEYDGDGRFVAATIIPTSFAAIITIPLFAVISGL